MSFINSGIAVTEIGTGMIGSRHVADTEMTTEGGKTVGKKSPPMLLSCMVLIRILKRRM